MTPLREMGWLIGWGLHLRSGACRWVVAGPTQPTQGPKLIMCFIVPCGPRLPWSHVDPVAMPTPEQMPFVEAVEDVAFCLVAKYTRRGLRMVGSRVSNSCLGGLLCYKC